MCHALRLFCAIICASISLVAHDRASAQATPVDSQLEQRVADFVAVLKGEKPAGEVLTDGFIAQVPEVTLRAMHRQMEAQMGALVGVERVTPGEAPGSATIALRFEQAIASGPMQLETAPPHRIASLLLNKIDPIADAATPVPDQVRALPGTASLLFTRLDGSEPLLAHNADEQLPIGSTFKLYVLSALSREIAAGRRSWDETVPLETRSYPSGILQDWPQGTALTLQSLATLMIAISDNIATDQLIATLGRETIEAELAVSDHARPELNRPFLTTREVFVLKAGDEAARNAYLSLDRAGRLAMLRSLETSDIQLSEIMAALTGDPVALDIEWFASARDISRILDRLKDDPVARSILAVNKGLSEEAFAGWDYVGYKGGSEQGVLNLSWLLRDAAGDWHVLSLGWTDPAAPVTTARLLAIASSALSSVDGERRRGDVKARRSRLHANLLSEDRKDPSPCAICV